MTERTAKVERKTNETKIEVFINLDCQAGSGNAQTIEISTGIGFLDHVSERVVLVLILESLSSVRFDQTDVSCPCKALGNVTHDEMSG